MKLRLTCKCGAEFEVSGLPGSVGEAVAGWRELHMVVCYGVDRVHQDDTGYWQIRPSPKAAADRLDQHSKQRPNTPDQALASAPFEPTQRNAPGGQRRA